MNQKPKRVRKKPDTLKVSRTEKATSVNPLFPSLRPDRNSGLTDKMEMFCIEYLRNRFNATVAAKLAGYKGKNQELIASRLLARQDIQDRLSELKRDVAAVLGISVIDIAKEWLKIVMFDARNLVDADGLLKPINELDDITAASIAGIDYSEIIDKTGGRVGRNVKVKTIDKTKALEALTRLIGADTPMQIDLNHVIAGAALERKLRYEE